MKYKTIEELFGYIVNPIRNALLEFYTKHKTPMLVAQGSQHNHQAWPGGYIDHIADTMNIARVLYDSLHTKRKLSFTLSDAMIVLFLHDVEKAFPNRIDAVYEVNFRNRPAAKATVRKQILDEENLNGWLTPEQLQALDNIEVERDYSNTKRGMIPLAAFCHMCDIASARLWFDHPLPTHEKWGWRTSAYEDQQLWAV